MSKNKSNFIFTLFILVILFVGIFFTPIMLLDGLSLSQIIINRNTFIWPTPRLL